MYQGWTFGHFFNNRIQTHYKTNSTQWQPELRLHGVWIPLFSMVCGLLTYGLTMHFGKHWIGIAFGWILVNIGMVGTIVYGYILNPHIQYIRQRLDINTDLLIGLSRHTL